MRDRPPQYGFDLDLSGEESLSDLSDDEYADLMAAAEEFYDLGIDTDIDTVLLDKFERLLAAVDTTRDA